MNTCDCDLCKLAQRINAERDNMTAETYNIIQELWARMETAETELELCKSAKI